MERSITRADWGFFLVALAALPLWATTRDPLLAVLLITLIDLLAYGPTLRKAWHLPHEESVYLFGVMLARNGLSIAALAEYTLTTLLFLVLTGLANIIVVGVILWRRAQAGVAV